MIPKLPRPWMLALALTSAVTTVRAETSSEGSNVSGQDQNTEAVVREAVTPKLSLVPVDDGAYKAEQNLKNQLKKATGLSLALDSTTIYQVSTGSRPANDAVETTTTLFGTWTLWQHENQIDYLDLGFSVENRSNYSGSSFQEMTGDLGTLWAPNDATSNDYTKIAQLWFGQHLLEDKLSYMVGVIDPGSNLNVNRYAGSTNTQYFSQPFATNPARNFADNGLGAVGRVAPVAWFELQGEISNGDAVSTHSPFTSIEGNWFKAGEVVFIPQVPVLGEGRYRAMVYQQDTESASTNGWALSFDQNLGSNYGAFFRYGHNDGNVNAIEQLASVGLSWLNPFGRKDDQTGIGFSWTRPSDPSFRDEYSSEFFYRVQLTNFIELSPGVQAIYNPSTTNEDLIGVFGMRLRVLF